MKLGLAQINPTVGDLEGNVARCLWAIEGAAAQGADLVVLPEMAIPGYPPRDILHDASFVEATLEATQDLARRAKDHPPALVGSIARSGQTPPGHPGLYNAAYLLEAGEARLAATKRLLPVYDVFLEPRWFLPGSASPPLEIAGRSVGILICEDKWDDGYPVHPPAEARAAGADLFVCISALPFRRGAMEKRLQHARRAGLPIALVNMVGANDELIFDGHSFILGDRGEILAKLAGFEEDVKVWDFPSAGPQPESEVRSSEAQVFSALTLGIRDFASKNGLQGVFVGLSGGIDSSVTAVLAAEALGAGRVTGVAIPSRYTDARSTQCARQLAGSLGIGFEVLEMDALHRSAEEALGSHLDGGTVAENIQARLRMLILMAFVNRYGGFLLNTSNKTELTLGYSTLYGDMAGTLSPLGDLTKPEVYSLARYINASRENIIPAFALEREPTAELKPGQVDPFEYETLSPELEKLVLSNQSNIAMRASEHKRWQMGIVLKVSEKSFGTGRLVPVTRK